MEKITPNAHQPRLMFDEVLLEELAHSIREKGVLQPLLVRPLGQDAYEIIAGERRWRAAQLAGLHQVPCRILSIESHEMMEIGLLENIQRDDLNPLEEAKGYRYLMDHFSYTQEKLAHRLGKSRSHIGNMLRILALPASVQGWVSEGKMSFGHAKVLAGASNPEALAQVVIDKDLTVRQTEALLHSGLPTCASKEQKTRPNTGQELGNVLQDVTAAQGPEEQGCTDTFPGTFSHIFSNAGQEESALLAQRLSHATQAKVSMKSSKKAHEVRFVFHDVQTLEDFIDRIQQSFRPSED